MLFWKLGLVVFSYQFVGTLTTGIGKHWLILSSTSPSKSYIYICICLYIFIYIYCLDQTTEKGLINLKRRDSPLCNFTESCRSDLVKTLCPKKCGKDLIYLVTLVSKKSIL